MIPFFPKQISYRAIIVYLISLAIVNLVFIDYAMLFGYIVLGMVCVFGFFGMTSYWTKGWANLSNRVYLQKVFLIAFFLRLIWVIGSYFYYEQWTGIPFEFATADALGYHEEAKWLASEGWATTWRYYFGPNSVGISDIGYPFYLSLIYRVIGPSIIIPRFMKAFLSAFTCILIYRLASRTFGETTGRMACIMTALMPNLIIYCGYHLKETEMLFLVTAFLERMDYLLRSKEVTFWNILLPSLLAGSLFFFRTVLGAAAVFSFATAVLVSSVPAMKRGWKRVALIGWGLLCLVVLTGGTAMTEIETLWEGRDDNVRSKRLEQTLRGNQWAQYATGTVMAPMVFVLPFSTMITVEQQYAQQTKHGGNYIRNFMGFFAFLAVLEAIRKKRWRDFALIGSFVFAYLGVISLSGFSNSERFLLPGLPGLIMMWAYGISVLNAKSYKWLTPWCIIVVVMEIAWAYFKLGSRGLI